DASPVKWHLAHTTWFFETFILTEALPGYRPFDRHFGYLFNSYYNAVGPRWPRSERGLLSRPTVAEIFRYRAYVDEHVPQLLERSEMTPQTLATLRLGLNHEQQHQELILTDIKHALAANPLRPVYRTTRRIVGEPPRCAWLSFPEGVAEIG